VAPSVPTAAALADVVIVDLLKGTPASETVATLAGKAGTALPEEALLAAGKATPAAVQVAEAVAHSGDVIEAIGKSAKAELDQAASGLPSLKAELATEELAKKTGKLKEPTTATRLGEAKAVRAWVASLAEQADRAFIEDALEDLEPALQDKIKQLWLKLPPMEDAEALARAIAAHLNPLESPKFLRAVHERLCDNLLRQFEGLVADPGLVAKVRAELAAVRQGAAAELAPLFRGRLRAVVAVAADESLDRIVALLTDPALRSAFLDRLFELIAEKGAVSVITEHFDTDGKRKVLNALASFVKDYTVAGARKALENLIGWMYEATRYVVDAVRKHTEIFKTSLGALLASEKFKNMGVFVGETVVHSEVAAQGLAKKGARQATDVMGTFPLTRGNRTVHVLATALESKGERGVGGGVKQALTELPKRFAKGSQVTTEKAVFTVGTDLFLTLEDALAALGVDRALGNELALAARGGADRYVAVVVSPLSEAAARASFPGTFKTEGGQPLRFAYEANPVPRATMAAAANGIAPKFGVIAKAAVPGP
jgi:hypothetical protein